MNPNLASTLRSLDPAIAQTHGNLAILPLISPDQNSIDYVTLAEAVQTTAFKIREVSESGSVPDLLVENDTPLNVLLLDGEEVAGAKQNRVFNASILVGAKSRLRVPVSCTEAGRWGYSRRDFRDSGNVMWREHRARKEAYVTASLRMSDSYRGDQSAVWNDIEEMQMKSGHGSRTRAMSDVYGASRGKVSEIVDGFDCVPGQVGMAVAIDGRLVGFDYISQPQAFRQLFRKLVFSCAIEAAHSQRRTASSLAIEDQYAGLLEVSMTAHESVHESVGLGQAHRFTADRLVGSSLMLENEPVHIAFFSTDAGNEDRPGRMSGFKARRGFRSNDDDIIF
ncbi:ARPP-1 family domain-containing protein [Bacteroidota bacterium]